MTNKLTPYTLLDSNFGAAQYFKSLLRRAQNGVKADLRAEFVRFAECLARRFTFGASSSIKNEAAQSLTESAMYCIGYKLKSMGEASALETLVKTPVELIWREGRDMIKKRTAQERRVLNELQAGRFKTDNRAYNDTLYEGLPCFFKEYDADFAAHESPGMIDYPLCADVFGLTGIEYISQYLTRLSIECRFCAGFDGHTEYLMRSIGSDYREAYLNIYELALTGAAGRVLCGSDMSSLQISAAQRERLKTSLGGMSRNRLRSVMTAAAERVCALIGITGAQDREYARSAMKGISVQVVNALDIGSLEALFMEYKPERRKVWFTDNACMDDDKFRKVTTEIRECRHISDKLALIKRHFNSIDDLADLLGASCLFGSEFAAVFETMDDETLALLYTRIFGDLLHVSEAEGEWQRELEAYLKAQGKTEHIRAMAESFEM